MSNVDSEYFEWLTSASDDALAALMFAQLGREPSAREIADWRRAAIAVVRRRLVRQPYVSVGAPPPGELIRPVPLDLPSGSELILDFLTSPEGAALLALARGMLVGGGACTVALLHSAAEMVFHARTRVAAQEIAPLGRILTAPELHAALIDYATQKASEDGRPADAAPLIGIPAPYLAPLNAGSPAAAEAWRRRLAHASSGESRFAVRRMLYAEGLRVLSDAAQLPGIGWPEAGPPRGTWPPPPEDDGGEGGSAPASPPTVPGGTK